MGIKSYKNNNPIKRITEISTIIFCLTHILIIKTVKPLSKGRKVKVIEVGEIKALTCKLINLINIHVLRFSCYI